MCTHRQSSLMLFSEGNDLRLLLPPSVCLLNTRPLYSAISLFFIYFANALYFSILLFMYLYFCLSEKTVAL